MKSTIKIFGAMFGLALAMTAAYASSGDRSEAPVAQHAVAARTPRLVVPEALSPAVKTLTCADLGGKCATRSVCIANNGVVAGTRDCPSGTVCCAF